MEGRSSADRRGDRYHVILCVVIGEMTLSTCLLCRLLTQDENQSASSPPIFQFLMKSGKDSTAVTTHYSPYKHIRDDFSHEASILDNVTGVFNIGSPSVVRIGYGKKSSWITECG